MKWIVNMKVKNYIRNWSNQDIHTKYMDVIVDIKIKDTNCMLMLEGNQNIDDVFRLIWELLSLYDGYFYEPISYEVDGIIKDREELIKLGYFKTDKKWYESELIGRSKRDLSTEVIEKYDKFRNEGMTDKKMTKSVINAFYYLKSQDYEKINVNHRLSLLLNIADGFIINTFRKTNNVKGSLDKLFKETVDIQKLKNGISLLGIDEEKFKYVLSEERHMFDHYIYKEDSLATFVYNGNEEIVDYATWYFVYILELVIRINILKEAGVTLNQEVLDYALESINDWIIYENDLDVECTICHYQIAQLHKSMGIEME